MALRYELEVFDELVTDTIHPKNLLHENSVSAKGLKEFEQKALAEIKNFGKRLKPIAFSFEKEKHRELFIRQHQSALIHLLDTLCQYIMPKTWEDLAPAKNDLPLLRLYKNIFAQTMLALDHIQSAFRKYFSLEEKIPDHQWMRLQQEWSLQIPLLKKQLTKLKTDKRLINILLSFLFAVTDSEQYPTICYRKMLYIKDLLQGLSNLKDMKRINNHCPHLNNLLVYLDFNETNFKDYLVNTICENVNGKTTSKEKLERLSFFYKEISQLHIRPGASLRPLVPSVKEDIKAWLAREIKYLEKTETLGLIVPAQFKDTEYKKGIWYTYTIEELPLLQRVQHEAGLITNAKIRPFIADLSKIAHIPDQHSISPKNLYNLFYNYDHNTISSLHDKLFLMINQLQKLKSQLNKKAKEKTTAKK